MLRSRCWMLDVRCWLRMRFRAATTAPEIERGAGELAFRRASGSESSSRRSRISMAPPAILPAFSACATSSAEFLDIKRSVPTVALVEASSLNATRFSSCESSAKIVGQTPWSARVPLDPLFATGSISSKREGRPGGRPRTGGPPHNFCRPSGHGKNERH